MPEGSFMDAYRRAQSGAQPRDGIEVAGRFVGRVFGLFTAAFVVALAVFTAAKLVGVL